MVDYNRGNPKNIIVGSAALFVAAQGVALPAFSTTVDFKETLSAPAQVTAGWRNVGYTMEGVEVSYEPDYGDVEVDQLLDSARIFKQGMRVMVNTTLAEPVFKNIVLAWGQTDASLTGTEAATQTLNIEVGDLGDAPVERQLCFVGPGIITGTTTKKQRVYHLFRAIQTESASMALRRTEATGLPVSFRILPGLDSNSAASYGVLSERLVA